jgi:hypothetical protein
MAYQRVLDEVETPASCERTVWKDLRINTHRATEELLILAGHGWSVANLLAVLVATKLNGSDGSGSSDWWALHSSTADVMRGARFKFDASIGLSVL